MNCFWKVLMVRGRIAIVGNIKWGLGWYIYERTAGPFMADFDCFHHLYYKSFPKDVAGWAAIKNVKAIVFGGSVNSPLDSAWWIREEEDFIKRAVDCGIPMLGICFGHEIIASALGGALGRFRKMHLARSEVEKVADDPLFDGFPNKFRALFSHSVYVAKVPPGFDPIARSDKCECMAMRHRELPIWSVQFHPEVDEDIKKLDRIWRPLADDEFGGQEGGRVLDNFNSIVVQSLNENLSLK
jgi:GMP synthase-like glutamine amidotransferase